MLVPLAFLVEIEERLLLPQADAFEGSEREEKASACSVRNEFGRRTRPLPQHVFLKDVILWALLHIFVQEFESKRVRSIELNSNLASPVIYRS